MSFISEVAGTPVQIDVFSVIRPLLPLIILLLIVLAGLKLLQVFIGGKRRAGLPALPQVQLNKKFIAYAELDFYRALQQAVGNKGVILAQVSLRQLLYFPGNEQTNPGLRTWVNKVARRSVDFVIVDPKTLRPMLVVELNDSSHNREDRQLRDEEVQAILAAAGVPLLTWAVTNKFDVRELAGAISGRMQVGWN